jgi:hypothetical protein
MSVSLDERCRFRNVPFQWNLRHRTVAPIALETVSVLGNVWKKFGKVNNKRCMGKNTDGKLSRNTYRKDS